MAILMDAEMKEAILYDIENSARVLNGLLSKHRVLGLSDADLKLYTTTVHGAKSALANINEKELSAEAYKLEKLGDDNKLDEVLSRTPAFVESLMKLMESLKS
jgi:HPt (histidine-containing phosphotransfer) domain-containing protein